jgi:hypothetical protein
MSTLRLSFTCHQKPTKSERAPGEPARSCRRVPLGPATFRTVPAASLGELAGFAIGRVLLSRRVILQPPHTSLTPVSGKWGAPEISRVHARERLLAQLDRLAPYACTWVTAPAGYGKTCLASAYAERSATPSLWYTLERSDSDVATFFADFSAGFRAVVPDAPLPQYSADIQNPAAFARAYFKHAFAHLQTS